MIIRIFFLYLSFQTKQLRNQFHSAPEKGLKIRSGAEANYVGFELNRQKTKKPTSLNICCSSTSQLVTNNPPDRVVMGDTKVDELYVYKNLGVLKNYAGSFTSNILDNIEKTCKKAGMIFPLISIVTKLNL